MIRLKELSEEELADLSKRGEMTHIAILQQELIKALEEKSAALEKELKTRKTMEELF